MQGSEARPTLESRITHVDFFELLLTYSEHAHTKCKIEKILNLVKSGDFGRSDFFCLEINPMSYPTLLKIVGR